MCRLRLKGDVCPREASSTSALRLLGIICGAFPSVHGWSPQEPGGFLGFSEWDCCFL